METYSFLRQLADSWVLLAMFGFFAGAAIWAFLPSQSGNREDASLIPFRHDDAKVTHSGTKNDRKNYGAVKKPEEKINV